MKLHLFAIVLLLTSVSFAQSKRSHGAHQHGVGELMMSFEGNRGVLELQAPSDAFFGFEHEAKTKAQKKAVEEAFAKLEKEMPRMVRFDEKLKCVLSKDEIEVVRESKNSKHSEVRAEFGIECEKSPAGTDLIFDFRSYFSKLKTIQVTVLVDNLQKSLKVESSDARLSLK